MGSENLKPCRSKEEARERGKKGGVASGEARRAKKTMKEVALALLDMTSEVNVNGKKEKKENRELLVAAQFRKAVFDGDLNSAKWLTELIGEAPTIKTEITGANGEPLIPQKSLSVDEAKEKLKELEELMK